MRFSPLVFILMLGCSRTAPESSSAATAPPLPAKAGVHASAGAVNFRAKDGKVVFADYYRSAKPSPALILLFHQAGSNAGEYAPIAPKLVESGFDCLAVDQRSGGEMWGRRNRTGDLSKNYMAAYQDMEAALDWAKSKKYKKITAWGSSYSASLVLKLAGDHPGIACVLSFSPGEYFEGEITVREWNTHNPSPTLMAFTPDEMTNSNLGIYKSSSHTPERNRGDMILSFPNSVHGSSTVREDKNPKGAKQYWQSVLAFLKAHGR